MGRDYKPHRRVEIRMDIFVYERLKAFCDDTGRTVTDVIEDAVDMYVAMEQNEEPAQ